MEDKFYSEDELKKIAMEVLQMLRTKRLKLCDVRAVLKLADEGLMYVVRLE